MGENTALSSQQVSPAGENAERIVAAAVRWRVPPRFMDSIYPDKLVVSAPPPARHHHLVHPLPGLVPADDQGFLTSTGRYVGREEALQIVLASGQQMIDHPARNAHRLFSEDLW